MKKKRGFTLIELVAVIVILGIILAIAIPSITGVIKSSSMKAFESDAKIVLKALDYRKMEVDNFDPTSVNKSTIQNLLKISDNNYSSLTIVIEAGTPVISIIGSNKWEGFIACGTFHNMKVVENATDCSDDNVYPTITLLGDNPVSMFINQTYTDAGATASDNIDGNMTSKIIVTSNLNPNVPGSYNVTYSITDSAGNNTTLNRTVNVIDNVAPIVTFGTNGNSTYAKTRSTTVTVSDVGGINTGSLKYLWNTSTTAPTEATFTTTLTNGSTISTPASVTGGYYLWILGKDTAGNTAITRSNVFNLDNTKPVITITGSNPASMIAGSTYTDAGATATDAHSGISGSVTSTSNISPNVIGSYTITYDVSDNAGNTQTATRNVNVTDTSPIVTANAASYTITQGASNALPGTYFSISQNGGSAITSTTCVDTSNGNVTVNNTSSLTVGTHVIKCTSNKITGLTANASTSIIVNPLITGIPAGTYATDTIVSYAGRSWMVMTDYGTSDLLILNGYLSDTEMNIYKPPISGITVSPGNPGTGILAGMNLCGTTYVSSSYCYGAYHWGTSPVKYMLENWLNGNSIMANDKQNGGLLAMTYSDQLESFTSYIRIPTYSEVGFNTTKKFTNMRYVTNDTYWQYWTLSFIPVEVGGNSRNDYVYFASNGSSYDVVLTYAPSSGASAVRPVITVVER